MFQLLGQSQAQETAHGELQAPPRLLRDLKLRNYVFPASGTRGCVIQLPLLLWRGDSSAAQAKTSSFPCSQPAAVPALSPTITDSALLLSEISTQSWNRTGVSQV